LSAKAKLLFGAETYFPPYVKFEIAEPNLNTRIDPSPSAVPLLDAFEPVQAFETSERGAAVLRC
jgi:hypothetical protein